MCKDFEKVRSLVEFHKTCFQSFRDRYYKMPKLLEVTRVFVLRPGGFRPKLQKNSTIFHRPPK